MKKIVQMFIALTLLAFSVAPAMAAIIPVNDEVSFQSADTTANSGDTIQLTGSFQVGQRIEFNASDITIDGNGFTITPTFTKTDNSNNSTLAIFGDDITIQNLTIDGTLGHNLHGINIYVAEGILLDGVSVSNNSNAGIVVNGSIVTVNNIFTSGNGWGGINVDLGGGIVDPASLTINGVSSHTEAAAIWVDDTTKAVTVIDTNEQYVSTDIGVRRVYALRPTTPVISGFINPSLNCGAITNIHSTTVDWSDSTGGIGGVVGYEYWINYPKTDGTRGDWKTILTASQYSGSLNEGLHVIQVRAKDNAGNFSEWSEECSITADWTAPDVEITNPMGGSTISGIVNIKGTVQDVNLLRYYFVVENSGGVIVAGPGTVVTSTAFTDSLSCLEYRNGL